MVDEVESEPLWELPNNWSRLALKVEILSLNHIRLWCGAREEHSLLLMLLGYKDGVSRICKVHGPR